jgi:T4 beta protein
MVDFSDFSYVPIVAVRPAEITALEELRPSDKDAMLPYMILRPWLTARQFESVLAKVEAVRSRRPIVIDLTTEPFIETRRPVHDEIDRLRNPENGYRNFFDLIEANENFIPSLQLAAPQEVTEQVRRFISLERGCVVRFTEPTFRFSRQIAELFIRVRDQTTVKFVLDYERQSRDLLTRAAGAIGVIEGLREVLPNCFVSVSASTFPENFVGLARQEIFERQFYDEVFQQIGYRNVIYSDRASVRAESLGGGSGHPAPRIDNALRTNWQFFRIADADDRDVAFQQAAEAAMESKDWEDLGVWGTDEIVRTANGDGSIASAARSTAVRINIHLHRQANFDDPSSAPGGEEVWSD